MFVERSQLESINAVDTNSRNIGCNEKLEIKCFYCDNHKPMKWSKAINNYNSKKITYTCPQCTAKKSKDTRSYKTKELLQQLCAIDTSPRNIPSDETIELKCHNCTNTGTKLMTDAQSSFKKHGHGFRCKECFGLAIEKRMESSAWLENIRKAAQTPEHKARAVINGKKRLFIKKTKDISDYWDFGDINVQMIAGTDLIRGRCVACKNLEYKPLKKFIEASSHGQHGCMKCWFNHTQTEEYSKTMGLRSAIAGSISRIEQGLSLSKYWHSQDEETKEIRVKKLKEALREWYKKNPDRTKSSKGELEVLDFVANTLGISACKNNDEKLEIDVFIESSKIGLEYNGLYWHSELQKENNYHIDKTNFFKDKGIRIIHVFADKWNNRKSQVKSYIKSALGLNQNKIYARKCEISEIDKYEANQLFEKYHIQGPPNRQEFSIGLRFNNELIACASFGKHHRGEDKWVLNRLVTKEDYSVIGGLSRISKYASGIIKEDIYTWADLSISEGSGYLKAGWIEDGTLPPDYFYTDGEKVISKQSRTKSKMNTPEDMTEHEHALLDGWYRVWDCGKIRFVYKFEKNNK